MLLTDLMCSPFLKLLLQLAASSPACSSCASARSVLICLQQHLAPIYKNRHAPQQLEHDGLGILLPSYLLYTVLVSGANTRSQNIWTARLVRMPMETSTTECCFKNMVERTINTVRISAPARTALCCLS